MNRSHGLSFVQLHLAVILFGLAGIFGKWLSLSPVLIVWFRSTLAALTLGLWRYFGHRPDTPVHRTERSRYLLSGGLLAAHWVTFFAAIQISTVTIGLLAYASFPVFVSLLEPVLNRERLQRRDVIAAIAASGGMGLIVPEFAFANRITTGVLFGLAAGFTFAWLTVLNRRFRGQRDALTIAFYQDSGAALWLLPGLIVCWQPLQGSDLLGLLALGIGCTALGHTLFIQAVGQIKAITAAISAALEPVYGILLAFFLLSEIPDRRTLAGGLIILITVMYTSSHSVQTAH